MSEISNPKGEVTEAFETTSGDIWYKAKDSNGKEYRVKQGEGRKSQQSFKAAKSHRPEVAVSERGQSVESAIENTITYNPDQAKESLEFQGTSVNFLEQGDLNTELVADNNKLMGYINSRDTPDDTQQAISDYLNMVDQLQEADSEDEREGIRREYGVGGS